MQIRLTSDWLAIQKSTSPINASEKLHIISKIFTSLNEKRLIDDHILILHFSLLSIISTTQEKIDHPLDQSLTYETQKLNF